MNKRFISYLIPILVLSLMTACSSTKPSEPDPVQQELLNQLKSLTDEINKLQSTQAELLEMKGNLAQMDSQLVVYQKALTEKEQDSKAKESEIIELRGNIDVLNTEITSLKGLVDTLKTAKDSLDNRLQEMTQGILPQLSEEQSESVSTTEDSGKVNSSDSTTAAESTNAPASNAMMANEATPPVMNKRDYRRQYNAALNKYFQRDYASAIKLFHDLIKAYPDGIYADNCQYWIGECYYSLENYQQAIEEFSKVSAFPENNKADHALFKIGMCYLQIGNKSEAEDIFHKVVKQYPESDLVPRVKEYFAGKKM